MIRHLVALSCFLSAAAQADAACSIGNAEYTRGALTVAFGQRKLVLRNGTRTITMSSEPNGSAFVDLTGTQYPYRFPGTDLRLDDMSKEAPDRLELDGIGAFARSCPVKKVETCDDHDAVHSNDSLGRRVIYFEDRRGGSERTVYIEEWRGKARVWRATGSLGCSNGASICGVWFDSNDPNPEQYVEANIETLGDPGNSLRKWVILPNFKQDAIEHQGLKVEWFNSFGPKDVPDGLALPENQYRFLACRKQ